MRKSILFIALKSLSFLVKGCALKLSHPSVCPVFLEFLPLLPITTHLLRGEGMSYLLIGLKANRRLLFWELAELDEDAT
jgi:hypothetical protein